MIPTITTGLVLLLILAAMGGLIIKRGNRRRQSIDLANNSLLVNITHEGRCTAVADAAFTSRYLICKRGVQSYSIGIAGAGDTPYGVVPDMTPTTDTDLSYPLPIHILGLNVDTERVIASGAIAIDSLVTTDANGQVRALPVAAGTYWIIGKAKSATAAAGDQLELIPTFPHQVTH